MDRALVDELTGRLIAYRKDEGLSAARIVAMALEIGFQHGVAKAAQAIMEHTKPMDEEALPVPPGV
jgi:hypothetical protein